MLFLIYGFLYMVYSGDRFFFFIMVWWNHNLRLDRDTKHSCGRSLEIKYLRWDESKKEEENQSKCLLFSHGFLVEQFYT
jgi:hypothetical protein